MPDKTEHLRVLIANERKDRLELGVPIVIGLGHEVIALLHAPDSAFVKEASKRGVFAAAVVDGHRLLPQQPDTAVEP